MEKIHQVSKNGDAAKNEETINLPVKQEKKGFLRSWWDNLPDEAQTIIVIGGTITGFIVSCIAASSVAETISASNTRKTLNTDGFKHLVDRGLLDPVPPPKTLEEAAARMVEVSPRMLPMAMTIEDI